MGIAGRKIPSRGNGIISLEAAALKDFIIGFAYIRIIFKKVTLVCVKTIHIFHHKFPATQKAGFCARFVSKLGLYLIRRKWQILI